MLNIGKIFRFRDFMSNFREIDFRPFLEVRKNFELLEHKQSYIILKRVIWRFQIYNCFAKSSNFAKLRKHLRISRNTLLLYLREF